MYEELLTEALGAQLGDLDPGIDAHTEPLRRADAPDCDMPTHPSETRVIERGRPHRADMGSLFDVSEHPDGYPH